MAPRSRDPDQPGISDAVRAKRLKMQEIGRQMEAEPPRSVVRKPRADDRSPEDIERDDNLTRAVDPRTGRLPMAIIENDEADPYHPNYRGTQTEEGMKWNSAIPEDEKAYMHLGKPGTRPSGIPLPPPKPAPPLSQPPIAKPSVPSGPPVRAPRGGGAPRPSVPGGIGSLRPEQIPVRPIAPTMRPDMPWKYESGGAVKKPPSTRGGVKAGREAVAGVLSDVLGARLQRRYDEEAAKTAALPPPRPVGLEPSPAVSGIPMYAKGGRVSDFGFAKGGGTNYGKDYRKGK